LISKLTSLLRVVTPAIVNRYYCFEHIIDQRIKGTLGITGLWTLRVPIKEFVWHLDVGSSHPGGA